GWDCKKVTVAQGGISCGFISQKALGPSPDVKGVHLNGGEGIVTSPVLHSGCNSLSFKYATRGDDAPRTLQIDIIQDENVVWSITMDTTVVTGCTENNYHTEGIPVEGDYQIVFKNITTGDISGTLARDILIWGICLNGPITSVAAPTFTVTGGDKKTENEYWEYATVSLATETTRACIYYTTDGTTPAAHDSLRYSEPFNVTATSTVKTIGIFEDVLSEITDTIIRIAGPQSAALPYTESFAGNLGDWYPYNKTGAQTWTTGEANDKSFARIEGADENGSYENEDWLISPAFIATEGCNLAFSFASATQYAGPALTLKYSTDYAGVGDPTTATWTDVSTATWPSSANLSWTESGDIVSEETLSVRFAFVYTSDTELASVWQLGDILAVNKDITVPSNPANLLAVPAEDRVVLSWTASSDNIAVAGYNVYIDEVRTETVAGTHSIVRNLTSGTEYTLAVEAEDTAGNKSEKVSTTVSTVAGYELNPGDTITLNLLQPVNPEYFTLTSTGHWTETSNDTEYPLIEFNYGNPHSVMSFTHEIGGIYFEFGESSWDGFTYSASGDSTNYEPSNAWLANQWGNMAGGGIKTDANNRILKKADGVVEVEKGIPYLVAYWGMEGMDDYYLDEVGVRALQTTLYDTYEAVGVYVSNHPWAYYSNKDGNAYARGLNQAGDYFKVIIHGLDSKANETGKTVEYTLAENKADEGLIQSSNWEWVDLSPLGEIGGLYYTLASTDAGQYGINTPLFFCLDKLQVRVPKKTGVNYPDADSRLLVSPNPFKDYITVKAVTEGNVVIYNLSGQPVLNATVKAGSNRINTSALPQGAYILKQGSEIVKIVKY
ncbi:MAG: DUF4465 domain-containing protein, partial [Dysgonamonadaceae bacterium]|nr:DUF4465 domain-containing protein [Dysgonamonadaceae bacterium]